MNIEEAIEAYQQFVAYGCQNQKSKGYEVEQIIYSEYKQYYKSTL